VVRGFFRAIAEAPCGPVNCEHPKDLARALLRRVVLTIVELDKRRTGCESTQALGVGTDVVMTKLEAEIGQAAEADLDGIVELQAANQADRGGSLSGSLPRFRIAEMMREMPLIVARRGGRIVGFLMTGTRAMAADVPIVSAMFAAYAGASNAYVYGPICVAAEERGKGLAQAMFSELRRLAPAREGILFIRRDNVASLRAHEKMGMREVASFLYGGTEFAVLSYVG
jgi:predicted GNAT superfamily acetyltransferase